MIESLALATVPLLSGLASAAPALARVVGFFLTAPPFSSKLAPTTVKVGMAIILWMATMDGAHAQALTTVDMVIASLSELIAGLCLGFMIQIAFTAFDVVGELISNGMGLSFPGSFDPIATESAGPASGLAQMMGIAVFVGAGGIELTASYLLHSFEVLPFGSSPTLAGLEKNGMSILTQSLMLGMANSAIIWVSLLLANLFMLISSRLSGGLNLMSSGLPLLLFIGLMLLAALLLPTINSIWSQIPDMLTQRAR